MDPDQTVPTGADWSTDIASESCSAVNKIENIRCDWRFKDSLLWLHRNAQVVGPSSLFTSTR